jgi:hypothetical protein
LANAPREKALRTTEETAGDQYTKGEKRVQVAVPWTQIDDNFYYARGVAYVLRHMMIASREDFKKHHRDQEIFGIG